MIIKKNVKKKRFGRALFILKSASKTCQLHPIPTPLLVECLDTLLPSLTALVNSSLSSGVFPEVVKTALVTPVLKKKIP